MSSRLSTINSRVAIKTMKHQPSVILCGTCSHKELDVLTILPSGKNGNTEAYISILNYKLLISSNKSNTTVFQQDLALCHMTRKMEKWFLDNNIDVLG